MFQKSLVTNKLYGSCNRFEIFRCVPTFMYEKNMVKLLLQGSTGLRTLESVLLSVAVICIPITVAKKTM